MKRSLWLAKRLKYSPEEAHIPKAWLRIIPEFITVDEETEITSACYPLLKFRYQGMHWDDVIVKYREVELDVSKNEIWRHVTERIHVTVTEGGGLVESGADFLPPHVVDLAADGYIGAHVDSVKFSGAVIAGLSLLSPRIMRLCYDKEAMFALDKSHFARKEWDIYTHDRFNEKSTEDKYRNALEAVEFDLMPRALYIMSGPLRYFFSHQVLGKGSPEGLPNLLENEHAFERRLSLVVRDAFVEQGPMPTAFRPAP